MGSATELVAPADLGLVGLGVMGENLALNLEDHGYRVALWTHTDDKVRHFVERSGAGRRLVGTRTLEEFAAALAPPRRILLMVKAGEPVDEMLERLAPLLSRGDVVIDGGNSLFTDTQRREATMRERGDGPPFVIISACSRSPLLATSGTATAMVPSAPGVA